jgi:hypothetical protein
MQKVERWKTEMPTEQEMLPKDKYSVFDRKVKRYRKGIHSEFGLVWYWWDVIADWLLQRCRSGRESARDSTPRVSRCVEKKRERECGVLCILPVMLRNCIGYGVPLESRAFFTSIRNVDE